MAITISASVGLNGTNRKGDVETIQKALNEIKEASGGAAPKLKVDGWIGPKTIGAIRRFQQVNTGLVADGRVDVNGSTLFRMNLVLEMQVTPPKPADPDPKTLALASIPLAASWAATALTKLQGTPDTTVQTALDTHFHVNNGLFLPAHYIFVIKRNYAAILAMYPGADSVFRTANDEEAKADRGVDKFGTPYPAYAFFQGAVKFTRTFRPWDGTGGFGEFCRAAMVLHEPVHYIDRRADAAHDFYEHGEDYAKINADLAAHNPSSYVCFAQHVYFGWDTRFGAGNPAA